MVLIVDDEDRENEGDLAIAAQFATPEAINFMASHGRGLICMPMLGRAPGRPPDPLDGRPRRPEPVDRLHRLRRCPHAASRPASRPYDRYLTVRALIDPATTPDDILRPGHLFPLRYAEGGVLRRAGPHRGIG